MQARVLANEFAREVRAGLTGAQQKTLPCRYLYDEVGSALFEAITVLPEYGLTRADTRVLEAHAGELAELLPPNTLVAELGSGSGAKTRPLLERIYSRKPGVYYPIDLSQRALARCAVELGTTAAVVPLEASYLDGLRQVAERRAPGQTLLLLFLGSTIGNFEPEYAIDFLLAVRLSLQPGDVMLLGTDLEKPASQVIAAYDDAAGVTAAFNLNLLARINRELEADFDLRQFEHLIRYDEEARRIEMHLRSRQYQIVNIHRSDLIVDLAPGETICTEACHKFRASQVREMARIAGFEMRAQWVDDEWPFAESVLAAV